MINPAFEKQLPAVVQLLKNHKIKIAYLFGSAATNRFNENSDVDLLISFQDGLEPIERGELFWSLQFALEDKLNRQIDIITEASLRNPYFIQSINKNKHLIYGY